LSRQLNNSPPQRGRLQASAPQHHHIHKPCSWLLTAVGGLPNHPIFTITSLSSLITFCCHSSPSCDLPHHPLSWAVCTEKTLPGACAVCTTCCTATRRSWGVWSTWALCMPPQHQSSRLTVSLAALHHLHHRRLLSTRSRELIGGHWFDLLVRPARTSP
jgi:hypothetical protein